MTWKADLVAYLIYLSQVFPLHCLRPKVNKEGIIPSLGSKARYKIYVRWSLGQITYIQLKGDTAVYSAELKMPTIKNNRQCKPSASQKHLHITAYQKVEGR